MTPDQLMRRGRAIRYRILQDYNERIPGRKLTMQEGKVTVEQVNEAVKEAGDMPKLTPKQIAKLEADKKRAWNTMISRKEAFDMINKALDGTNQQMQMLFVQNRTLIELIEKKGIATVEEINELSKAVIESLFGKPPVDEQEEQKEKEENENA